MAQRGLIYIGTYNSVTTGLLRIPLIPLGIISNAYVMHTNEFPADARSETATI